MTARAFLVGKPRLLGGGQRSWRAALYQPGGRYRRWRVRFMAQENGQWSWTSRNADDEASGRRILAEVEKYLDGIGQAPPRASESAERTVNALGDLYLDDSRSRGRAVRTIEGRASRLRCYIRPVIGELQVSDWDVEGSGAVIALAQKTVHSAAGLQDVRSILSAMRRLAWRHGWLSREVDPLDGLELPRSSSQHGSR